MFRNGVGVSVLCLAALAALTGACSPSESGPRLTAPSNLAEQRIAEQSPSHGLQLIAVAGSGSGIVNVTANARAGAFTANTQDAINVHGVTPDTVLYVRAAADVGLPGGQQADGACQRAALGQFQPLLSYPGGPSATLETSPGGAGATHVVFGLTNPFTQDGASLDLVLRLVNALPPAVPTVDLRTPCFTLEIK
jgi:hypothetical protein